MTKFWRIVLMGLLLLGLAACMPRWQKPELRLLEVSLAGGSLLSQNLLLELEVRNPNARAIGVEGLDFEWLLGDEVFARGVSLRPVVVPANGQTTLSLQASLQVLPLLQRLPALIDAQGMLPYRVRGKAQIQRWGDTLFDQRGVLDLQQLRGQQIRGSGSPASSSR